MEKTKNSKKNENSTIKPFPGGEGARGNRKKDQKWQKKDWKIAKKYRKKKHY